MSLDYLAGPDICNIVLNPAVLYLYVRSTVYVFMPDISNADLFVCFYQTSPVFMGAAPAIQRICMAGLPKKR